MKTENIQRTLAAGMQLPHGGNLNLAQILTPRETQKIAVTLEKDEREHLHGQWLLCGDVTPLMFTQICGSSPKNVGTRLSAFSSPEGRSYAVVTHQLGGFQHRLTLCLYDPPVREFLKAVSAGEPLRILLGKMGDHAAVTFESRCRPIDYAPLFAMAKVMSTDEQELALMELPNLVEAMSAPAQIPSLFHEPVTVVCNSLLLPKVMREKLAAVLDRVF